MMTVIPGQRFNPVFVAIIDDGGKIMKFPDIPFVYYLDKMKITGHNPKISKYG